MTSDYTPLPPAEKLRSMIRRAVLSEIDGHCAGTVAVALGLDRDGLYRFRLRHQALWHEVTGEVIEGLTATLRAAVGTEAVLLDPKRYVRMCEAADDWHRDNFTELFPTKGLTLGKFFRDTFTPVRLRMAAECTRKLDNLIMKRWVWVTGDPPLREITPERLSLFRDFLLRLGQRPATTGTYLRLINSVLGMAGPAGPRRRDAVGILERIPWVAPPPADPPMPKIVSLRYLGDCYQQADRMREPTIPNVAAADWWRALLVVAYNTGLRHRSLFAMLWEHVDVEGRRLKLPPSAVKTRKWLILPLNQTSLEHLERIRGARRPEDFVFPWPYHNRTFWLRFRQLQSWAGIPEAKQFGLHTIRRTLATQLAAVSIDAARMALGHAADTMTLQHYIDVTPALTVAINGLEQPKAFLKA